MNDVVYKLEDLVRAAGTSARTVRYYVQRGLLPAPAFKGKDTAYGSDHLVRLRAIRKLQDAFFPLDAIAVELERRSLAEIERIASGAELPTVALPSQTPPPRPSTSGWAREPPERLYRRIELAPGVELSIAQDAPEESRQIADAILRSQGRAT